MEEVVSNLLRLLPVFLGIIWVLRLVDKRRRSKNRTGSEQSRAAKETGKVSRLAEHIHALETETEISTPIGNRAVPRKESGKIHPSPPMAQGMKYRERMVKAHERKPVVVHPVLTRKNNLSPLARGLIWKTILDEPPSLRGF